MRDEEQGGHRWERVRGKHSRRCAPATGGVPMPKMRCIDRKVRAESRSSEQTNLGSSTCHGLPCGFAVITNRFGSYATPSTEHSAHKLRRLTTDNTV